MNTHSRERNGFANGEGFEKVERLSRLNRSGAEQGVVLGVGAQEEELAVCEDEERGGVERVGPTVDEGESADWRKEGKQQ